MRWLRLLRKYPAFARFWLSEAISLAGDWFSLVAVSVLAMHTGGDAGPWAVATTLAAYELPMASVRPWAGVLADRFDRRNLLFGVHVGQMALTLLMAARAAVGDLVGLQVLVVARSLLAGLDWPARAGAMRRLVDEEDLLAVNAFGGATWSAMYAVGMALGGLVSSLGVPLALTVDAASFAVAAGLLATLPSMPTGGGGSLAAAAGRALADLREAGRTALADPRLLRAVLAKTPFGLAGGAAVVLLNVVADAHPFIGSGAATLGVLQATRGVGTGVGPLLVESLLGRGWSMTAAWRGMLVVGFGGILAFGASDDPVPLLLAAACWGAGTGANWMLSAAELQRTARDETLGRLSGLDMLSVELSFGASALAGGLAIGLVGPWGAIAVSLGAGGLAWLAVHR